MWLVFLLFSSYSVAGDFQVATPGTAVRGSLWVSDGPALVSASGSTSVANRFQLGAELHLLPDYRLLLGCTLVDELSSTDSATTVGQVSRGSADFTVGYFLVPDKFWVQYSAMVVSLGGSDVFGYNHAFGHGPSAGWRFYDGESMNLSLVGSYARINGKTISVVDLFTSQNLLATYPAANVFSVSLRVGLDWGGRRLIPGLSN